MRNLIQNDQWFSKGNDKILYFTNTGAITYDKFCLNNFRFCSLSMASGSAANHYELQLPLQDAKILRVGYHMRAIAAQKVKLEAIFYNEEGQQILCKRNDVTNDIDADFHDVSTCFEIPKQASSVSLSLLFEGKITACTFGMPFAELYQA